MKKLKKVCSICIAMVLMFGLIPATFAAEKSWADDFRVVGYYSGGLFNEAPEKMQFDKLTHIMYAFLIPKEDGSFEPLEKPEQLKELVRLGHEKGTEIFIAIGGWSYQNIPLAPTFEKFCQTKEGRAKFIENVVNFVKEYDLDGVEIDWEYPSETSAKDYESLVVEMGEALKANGKELSAAVNGAWSPTEGPSVSNFVTKACLNSFSFINVMIYDMNNAEHSPLWFADTSIAYWLNRGVSADKIVAGIPLYARPSWMQYRHLVEANPAYGYVDYAPTTPTESYYNGLNTIREKTTLALRKAGGVMLFDVNEDAQGELSAVSLIDQSVKQANSMDKEKYKKHITVIVNNKEVIFLPAEGFGEPFADENNRTLVPMRKALEVMGAEVGYDEDARQATAQKGGTTLKVVLGEKALDVNGKRIEMDTNAINIEGRTYIPARAVYEAFGYEVFWSQLTQTVFAKK